MDGSSRRSSTPTTPPTEQDATGPNPAAGGAGLTALLASIPDGWTRVRVEGRSYGLTRTAHAGGRTLTIHAEELGGADVVSANVLRTSVGDVLKPCEMPTEKVLGFLRAVAEEPRPMTPARISEHERLTARPEGDA